METITKFTHMFELAKSLEHFEAELWVETEATDLELQIKIREYAREFMKYDRDAGMMLLFVCLWSRYREVQTSDSAHDDFVEYLKWLIENSPKTHD